VNPWILGNIVIGGLPGLIVDNATGAAWMPRHSEIHRQLAPLGAYPDPNSMYSGAPAAPQLPTESPRFVAGRETKKHTAAESQNQSAQSTAIY
jgi:hypothetical protein